jgi:hypothetical protein
MVNNLRQGDMAEDLRIDQMHSKFSRGFIRLYGATKPVRTACDSFCSNRTKSLILRVYEVRPTFLRKILLAFAVWLRKISWFFLREMVVDVLLYQGVIQSTNDPIKLIYFGDRRNEKSFIHRQFDEGYVIKIIGKCTCFELRRLVKEIADSAELIVVERICLGKWVPPDGEWVRTPSWTRMVWRFTKDDKFETVIAAIGKSQSMNIKRVKRADYKLEFSKEPADFSFFFDRMQEPAVVKRHGEDGIHYKTKERQELARIGLLSFVCLPDGTRVSGSVGILRNGIWYGIASGFLDGDEKWLKAGALSALYLLSLQFAVEHDVRIFDVDNAFPIMSNGLFRHKLQWGFHPEINPWYPKEWIFWMPKQSENALSWLKANVVFHEYAHWHGENLDLIYAMLPDEVRQR